MQSSKSTKKRGFILGERVRRNGTVDLICDPNHRTTKMILALAAHHGESPSRYLTRLVREHAKQSPGGNSAQRRA